MKNLHNWHDRPHLRICEVADILGVHPNTVLAYEKRGILQFTRRRGMKPYVHGRDLKAALEGGK